MRIAVTPDTTKSSGLNTDRMSRTKRKRNTLSNHDSGLTYAFFIKGEALGKDLRKDTTREQE